MNSYEVLRIKSDFQSIPAMEKTLVFGVLLAHLAAVSISVQKKWIGLVDLFVPIHYTISHPGQIGRLSEVVINEIKISPRSFPTFVHQEADFDEKKVLVFHVHI